MSKLYIGNKLIIDPALKLERRVLTQEDYDRLPNKKNNVVYVVTDAPNPLNRLVEVEDYFNTHKNDDDIHVPTEREEGQLLSVDENDYLKWRDLDKSDVGLDKVDNTADADKPVSTIQAQYINKQCGSVASGLGGTIHQIDQTVTQHTKDITQLQKDVKTANDGINGVYNRLYGEINRNAIEINRIDQTKAPIIDGKIPSNLLPSYVDDVLEFANKTAFPTTGESGIIYIDTTANKIYRWGGTTYVEIPIGLALGETSSTAYAGDKGKSTTDKVNSHVANTSNPHNVTKAQVGLGNVTNDPQVKRSEIGVANGVSTLDSNGKIPTSQLPDSIATLRQDVNSTINSWTESKGKPNGFASLDINGKIPVSQLPSSVGTSNLVLGETTGTAYDGAKGKQNADIIKNLPTECVDYIGAGNTSSNEFKLQIGFRNKNTAGSRSYYINIPLATTSIAGIISADDKVKINSIDNLNTTIGTKVDKIEGKQLSTNDYTTEDKNKLAGIQTGAQVNTVTSVNGQTGAVVLSIPTQDSIDNKVDKVTGKELSTNDYTNDDKAKIDNLPYYVHIHHTEKLELQSTNYSLLKVTLEPDSTSESKIKELITNENSNPSFHIKGIINPYIIDSNKDVYIDGIASQYNGVMLSQIKSTIGQTHVGTTPPTRFCMIEFGGFEVYEDALIIKVNAHVIK